LEPGVLQLLHSTDLNGDPANTGARTGKEMIFGISCATEQAPVPENRVTLSRSKDLLGLNETHLNWRPASSDHRNLSRNLAAVARAFGAWGKADVRILFNRRDVWTEAEEGWGCHHMGTTRMSDDPRKGVVDADCRVHGVDNLYVAGSSVFTTGGAVNPTLTVVALAVRLADHLKSRNLNG
jgi:choline dehydrogenase-like flavoprotein